MSETPIRFRIHDTLHSFPGEYYSSANALFQLYRIVGLLPFYVIDTDDGTDINPPIERKNEINISVQTQKYNNTCTKFIDCVICTDAYHPSDDVVILECGHVFHDKCIKEWGHYKPECPLCKAAIPVS